MGGVTNTATDVHEMYDPSTDSWTTKAAMPAAVSGHGLEAVNGKIYVRIPSYYIYEYDPSTNTWTSKYSVGAVEHFAAEAPDPANGKVYFIGGVYSTTYYQSCEEYDPSANTLTGKADMTYARAYLDAGSPGNGKIYAVAGYNANGDLTYNEQYDPSTNTWTTKASPSLGGRGPAVEGCCNRLYKAGGLYGGAYRDEVEEYDPATDSWASVSDMPTGKGWIHGAAAVIGNKIYVPGGYDGSSNLSENPRYDRGAFNAPLTGVMMKPDKSLQGVESGEEVIPATGTNTYVFVGR